MPARSVFGRNKRLSNGLDGYRQIVSGLSVTKLPLAGLRQIERCPSGDHRGLLARLFCAETLALAGWTKPIAQINHTYTSKQGTVRGLHFQYPPRAEMKLVSCIRGEVWDVALDIRAGSSTFLRWHAIHLSRDNARALLIPEGFAHGFQSLTDDVEIIYCHSQAYSAEYEGGICPTDPRLNIPWPRLITDLSRRDAVHPFVTANFKGISV